MAGDQWSLVQKKLSFDVQSPAMGKQTVVDKFAVGARSGPA